MEHRTRFALLTGATCAFSILALLSSLIAVHLVWLGAYPPVGQGSLGHVGAVVAGIISGFVALVFVLLAIYTGLRARAVRSGSLRKP